MFFVTIVPLSLPGLMTDEAKAALRCAKRLFLQTDRHPFARLILEEKLPYTAMDDLYASAEDFDALNAQIAQRLAAAGACVYAVTGNVAATQFPAIRAAVASAGGQVRALAGIPAAYAAFPGRQIDAVYPASQLPARLLPKMHIAVEEICDPILAGEVKLALGEYYPDDWEILLASAESGDYQIRSVPLYALDRQQAYHATTAAYVPAAPFDRLSRYGYGELCDVIARLRAPGGCPWDREQTHESLKQPLLEECYELIDAIEQHDDANLCEELGDVLMQVALHAAIAGEQGRFTERDVATGVVQKLIYRHPHVFGSVQVSSSDEVLVNWDRLKMAEKRQQTQTEALKSIPRCFPALTRAAKVQKKAAKVGFDWPDARSAFPKIAEETDELNRAMSGDGSVGEEAGDLLFAAVNVIRLLGLDPEFLLRDATDKFIDRFAAMEAQAAAGGKCLSELSFSALDKLWDCAKITRKV